MRANPAVSFREHLEVRGKREQARVRANPIEGLITFRERCFSYSITFRNKQTRLTVTFEGSRKLELLLSQDKWHYEETGDNFTGQELADFCMDLLVVG